MLGVWGLKDVLNGKPGLRYKFETVGRSLVGGPGLPVLEALWDSGDSFLERVLLMGSRGFDTNLKRLAPFSNSSTFGGQVPPSADGLSHL